MRPGPSRKVHCRIAGRDDARAARSASRFGYPGDGNGVIMGSFGTPSPGARGFGRCWSAGAIHWPGPSHVSCGVVWADRTRGDAKSVAQQLDVLCGLAVREGVQVVAVFRDDGISASSFAHGAVREGWVQTMEVIASGRVDELWVWEVSRATRDRAVYAALIGACTVEDVKITVNGRVHDPNDPDDAFMLDLGAALAVKESALTSKRIRRDVAARAAQGRPHGRIPYGYQREYDPHTGALLRQVPDPATAPLVRELARRVLAGEALYRLAAERVRLLQSSQVSRAPIVTSRPVSPRYSRTRVRGLENAADNLIAAAQERFGLQVAELTRGLSDQDSLSTDLGRIAASVSVVEQAAQSIVDTVRAGCPSAPSAARPPPAS